MADTERRLDLVALSRAASTQHGLVTRAQAVGMGYTDDGLARCCRLGVLERVVRGVYRFRCVPSTFEQRTMAACLAGGGAVACRETAMRLYGFDEGPERPPDVLARPGRHRPVSGGRTVHRTRRLRPDEVVRRRGVPLTSPLRTLRDVAVFLPQDKLERFLGHLLATRELPPAQLAWLATSRGPGGPALRVALERAGVSTAPDSVLEHEALRVLRRCGLPEPVAQYRLDLDGRDVVLDFAWPSRRVALEVDGYRWHADPRSFAGDRRRDNRLQALGWIVYRTTFAEIAAGAADLVHQLRGALGVVSA